MFRSLTMWCERDSLHRQLTAVQYVSICSKWNWFTRFLW